MNKNTFSYFNRLSLYEQATFTKRLAFLIKANVPIIESLEMLKRRSKSKYFNQMMDRVIKDVSNGQLLSASLAKHKNAFSPFALNVIRVGEEGGVLDSNLEYLSEELRKKQELKKKVIGALIYPVFIIVATICITGLIAFYIFPKIVPVFKSFHAQLPLATRGLLWFTDVLTRYGWYLGGGLLVLIGVVMILYAKVQKVRFALQHVALKMPIAGQLIQAYQMANFCRTLGLLLHCQMTIVGAMRMTADATPHDLYRREYHKLTELISRGQKISSHLEKHAYMFPTMVPELIAIGETIGNLGDTLMYLSNHYEGEVSDMTQNLSASIEPALLLGIGLVVGFVAVSVITPIYDITQHLHP